VFDKDEQKISRIIDQGLEDILSGEASLGDVLRRHPELAAQIQPELEAALWLVARQGQLEPDSEFVAASRQRVLGRIRQAGLNQAARRGLLGSLWSQQSALSWIMALIILVLLYASSSGIISISKAALPDQQLYSIKRVSEEVVLSLTLSNVRKADLRAEFTERRLNEVEQLITRGDYTIAAVTLSEFEKQVNHSLVLLQEVSDLQYEEKGALANQIREDFSAYATRLDALKPQSPDQVQVNLERARDVSLDGASQATHVYADMEQKKKRATLTLSLTVTLTHQPATRAANTVQPSATQTQTPQPSAAASETAVLETPEVTETATPAPTYPPIQADTAIPDEPDEQPVTPTEEIKPTQAQDALTNEVIPTDEQLSPTAEASAP